MTTFCLCVYTVDLPMVRTLRFDWLIWNTCRLAFSRISYERLTCFSFIRWTILYFSLHENYTSSSSSRCCISYIWIFFFLGRNILLWVTKNFWLSGPQTKIIRKLTNKSTYAYYGLQEPLRTFWSRLNVIRQKWRFSSHNFTICSLQRITVVNLKKYRYLRYP